MASPLHLSSSSASWSTLDRAIVKHMSEFLSPKDTRVIPCVCRAWNMAMGEDLRVGKMPLFSSENHKHDVDFVKSLEQLRLQTSPHLTFIEGEFFERPKRGLYSLEELPKDNPKSFDTVILMITALAQIRLLMGEIVKSKGNPQQTEEHYILLLEEYEQVLKLLYQDPYFKKIVMNETFHGYDPHNRGLDSEISYQVIIKPTKTPQASAFIAQLKDLFLLLDKELPGVTSENRSDALTEKTGKFIMTAQKQKGSALGVLSTIGEFAVVAKTTVVGKSLKHPPVTVGTLYDALYPYSFAKHAQVTDPEQIISKWSLLVHEELNGNERSKLMVRKVIATLKQMAKQGVNLNQHSIYIYTGKGHQRVLKDQLKLYSLAPPVVKVVGKPGQELSVSGVKEAPASSPDLRVGKITIVSTENHSQDNERVIGRLKETLLKTKSQITFLENLVFDVPDQSLFSLELLHSNEKNSLGSVVQLAMSLVKLRAHQKLLHVSFPVTDSFYSMHRDAVNTIINDYAFQMRVLYTDPYCKKLVLEDHFKGYNPHKRGLDPKVSYKEVLPSPSTPQAEAFIKEVKELFLKLDKEMPRVSPEKAELHLTSSFLKFLGFCMANPECDLGVVSTISEFAAVAKTLALHKKQQGEVPFTVETLYDAIYLTSFALRAQLPTTGMQTNLRWRNFLLDEFNGKIREGFMTKKITSVLKELHAQGKIPLKDRSIFLYIGAARGDRLLEKLQPLSLTKPTVVGAKKFLAS